MAAPLAYFLTWTCHGTWLHGDERGSVDRQHNVPGTPYLPPQPRRRQIETQRLRQTPVTLGPRARRVVERAVRDHCQHRGWTLLAVNVRSNHVHVVVTCTPDVPPERALTEFKAWSTRRLRGEGHVSADVHVWTHHGSTRWINDATSLNAAVAYVTEGQSAERFGDRK